MIDLLKWKFKSFSHLWSLPSRAAWCYWFTHHKNDYNSVNSNDFCFLLKFGVIVRHIHQSLEMETVCYRVNHTFLFNIWLNSLLLIINTKSSNRKSSYQYWWTLLFYPETAIIIRLIIIRKKKNIKNSSEGQWVGFRAKNSKKLIASRRISNQKMRMNNTSDPVNANTFQVFLYIKYFKSHERSVFSYGER